MVLLRLRVSSPAVAAQKWKEGPIKALVPNWAGEEKGGVKKKKVNGTPLARSLTAYLTVTHNLNGKVEGSSGPHALVGHCVQLRRGKLQAARCKRSSITQTNEREEGRGKN